MKIAACWCGEESLKRFSREYGVCSGCGSLVFSEPYDPGRYVDGSGFYGPDYWLEHVPKVDGLPSLEERAEEDMADRAAFHLERVVEYCEPGSTVLELGCGHGGLTYLLGCAGLAAEGLEVSPPAVEVARSTFGIAVHTDPLEELEDLPRYDAIVAVDLIEHLPWPRKTLAACRSHVRDGGLLMLQTPRFAEQGPDWSMLIPEEHLFLFTESSLKTLLEMEGFHLVEMRQSFFSHDMWVVASAGSATVAKRREPSADIPAEIRALWSAVARRQAVEEALAEAQGDQSRKERLINQLSAENIEIRQDQEAKELLVQRVAADLDLSREDQAHKETLIEDLSAELETVRRDQADKESLIRKLSSELEAVREDQAAKETLIVRISSELEEVRADQTTKQQAIDQLVAELEQPADRRRDSK